MLRKLVRCLQLPLSGKTCETRGIGLAQDSETSTKKEAEPCQSELLQIALPPDLLLRSPQCLALAPLSLNRTTVTATLRWHPFISRSRQTRHRQETATTVRQR